MKNHLSFIKKHCRNFLKIELSAKKIKFYLQYQIGLMYFQGLGTAIDKTKAAEYFEKSADKICGQAISLADFIFLE